MIVQSFVYVIGPQVGFQKIGIARVPEKRRNVLQIGHPEPIVIHSRLETDRASAFEIENRAHKLLSGRLVRGEWFDVSPAVATRVVRLAWMQAKRDVTQRVPVSSKTGMGSLRSDGFMDLSVAGLITPQQMAAGLIYRDIFGFVMGRDEGSKWNGTAAVARQTERWLDYSRWLDEVHEHITENVSSLACTHLRQVVGQGQSMKAKKESDALLSMTKRLQGALDALQPWLERASEVRQRAA